MESGGVGKRAWGAARRAVGARLVVATAAALVAAAGCQGGAAGAPAASTPPNVPGAAKGSTPPAASAPLPTARRPRVLFVGTSLTAGLGLDPDSAYPALVERLADSAGAPIVAVNAGVSGETSAGALRRIDWVLREPADVVVIETGANDGLRGQSPEALRENLVAIVRRVRAARPAARVVLVQMEAPRNLGAEYTRRFHDAYAAAAREAAVPLWPFLLEGVAGEADFNQADGVHPNEAGARRVAATVWAALAPVVAATPAG